MGTTWYPMKGAFPMANVSNHGVVEGRLTRDPKFFVNPDGSKKVFLNVAVKRDYRNKNGEVESDFPELVGFVRKGAPNNGVYDRLSARDRVGIMYSLHTSKYQGRDGNIVYKQECRIDKVALRETIAEAERHRQMSLAEKAAAAAPAQMQLPLEEGELPFVSAEEVIFENE